MISESIATLLEPQECFDALSLEARRRLGPALCDLAYPNAYDGVPAFVRDAIRQSLDEDRELDLQYTPYGGTTITRRRIAETLSGTTGLRFGWRSIIMTPGAMAALNIVFRDLADAGAGSEVVIVSPCWLDYPLYLVNLGVKPVFAPVDPRSLRLDLDVLADAITDATRAVVLSQPANPTGLIYSPEELRALARLLYARRGGEILLVSDECHRDVIHDQNELATPAAFYERTVIVYSFGKAFFMQGQRTGYVAVGPAMPGAEQLAHRYEQLCRVMGYCTPTALMQRAVRRLLGHPLDFQAIARRRSWMLEALSGTAFSLVPSQATFFLYPATGGRDDLDLTRALALSGVLVLPARIFHHTGHFRISLTAPDDHVRRAAHHLRALGGCAA